MKTILVTGATSGIGKACARIFAKQGFRVIINGRRKYLLDELNNSLAKEYQADVLNLPFDVRKEKDVFRAIQNLPKEWKNIDLLVNSAGLALGKDSFDEAHLLDWETMVDTNIKGLLYVTKAVLPTMIERKKGHVINISSIAGDFAYQRGNIYCASKSAVNIISQAMRTDLLKHHIKVTNIKPGAVETEFSIVRYKGDDEKAEQTYEGFTPLSGNDIANVIMYCALLPEHVCINDLIVTPTAQSNGVYIHRESV